MPKNDGAVAQHGSRWSVLVTAAQSVVGAIKRLFLSLIGSPWAWLQVVLALSIALICILTAFNLYSNVTVLINDTTEKVAAVSGLLVNTILVGPLEGIRDNFVPLVQSIKESARNAIYGTETESENHKHASLIEGIFNISQASPGHHLHGVSHSIFSSLDVLRVRLSTMKALDKGTIIKSVAASATVQSISYELETIEKDGANLIEKLHSVTKDMRAIATSSEIMYSRLDQELLDLLDCYARGDKTELLSTLNTIESQIRDVEDKFRRLESDVNQARIAALGLEDVLVRTSRTFTAIAVDISKEHRLGIVSLRVALSGTVGILGAAATVAALPAAAVPAAVMAGVGGVKTVGLIAASLAAARELAGFQVAQEDQAVLYAEAANMQGAATQMVELMVKLRVFADSLAVVRAHVQNSGDSIILLKRDSVAHRKFEQQLTTIRGNCRRVAGGLRYISEHWFNPAPELAEIMHEDL